MIPLSRPSKTRYERRTFQTALSPSLIVRMEGPLIRCLPAKQTVAGRAALYVCRNFSCQQPLTDAVAVAETLRELSKRSPQTAAGLKLQGRLLDGRATVEGTARYAARVVNVPRPDGRFEYGFDAVRERRPSRDLDWDSVGIASTAPIQSTRPHSAPR